MFREMVGIEFEEAVAVAGGTYDDVFTVLLAFGLAVHGSPEGIDASYIHTEVMHAPFVGSGGRRELHEKGADGFQTVNNACFEVFWHMV